MSINRAPYSLVGGAAVKIKPLEVTEQKTYYAEEGFAFNPVKCDVSEQLQTLSETITENGDNSFSPGEGTIGFSSVSITTSVPSYTEEVGDGFTAAAKAGMYFCKASVNGDTVLAQCTVTESGDALTVSDSAGSGTFAIEDGVLTWTLADATDAVIYFAENIIATNAG